MNKSRVLFLSAHEKSVTGGNKRFERLAMYGVEEKGACWVSIQRKDLNSYHNNILFLKKNLFPTFSLRFLFACIFNLSKIKTIVKENKCSKIIIFGETPMLGALYLSWILKLPISVGVRSNVPRRFFINLQGTVGINKYIKLIRFRIKNFLLRKVYFLSESVVVQSPKAKEEFCENYGVNRHKVFVLPNDLPVFSDTAAICNKNKTSKPRRLLFVGNSSLIKGFDILIEFVHILIDKNLIDYITLVGVSESDIIKSPKIRVIERSSEVLSLMREHDLLVVPSREDQFPNVVLEAFSIGLPVIGSDVDGISLMINSKDYLFQPGNVNSLLEKYFYLLDSDNYIRLRSYVLIRASEFIFNWEEEYFNLI